ncbi:protein RodZ, contains Xre-like HTH and DUF4115 domains [Pelagirhabdus alkalitolerans]|uniref:Protein RodZ, contains Xre-like HTH and DUF4115 domains n=2 Tax=Pelagirhabdus alkalitolerans TaxID=1612202 RepID=A0A1G6H4F6_9BACI|nr:protein RodZ, contains Xre-like HTH and DUF4115 domains [Pelagirhabdus alkalitolerans]
MQIGERLKEARLEKELTIEDVQRLTKIQTRHLQAIERNDFSVMPGQFYAKAFIKEYASAVGLDPYVLMEEHQSELPQPDQEAPIQYTRSKHRDKQPSKSSPFATLLPTIFVVILIAAVGFFIWQIAMSPDDESPDEPQEVTETDDGVGDEVSLPPEEEEEDDEENDTDDEEDEENDNDTEDDSDEENDESDEEVEPTLTLESFENDQSIYYYESDEESFELSVDTTESSWLEVEDEDGESLHYATLQSSEAPISFDVPNEGYIYLRFGNPGSVSLSINDQEIELSEEIQPTAVQQLWLFVNEEPES